MDAPAAPDWPGVWRRQGKVHLKASRLHLTLARSPRHLGPAPLAARQARRGPLPPLLVGLASLAGHWLVLGVRLGGDSPRYLEAASRLLSGLPLVDKQADFWAYDWLVAGVFFLGGGQGGVVAAQCLLSLAAGLLLYAGVSRALGHPAGLLASLAYLLWPDLQRWNCYLLSDGPCNSLLAASLGLALLAARRWSWWLLLAPVLAALALMRPEAVFFLLPLALYFFLGRQPAAGLALLAGAVLLLMLKAPSPASTSEILEHWGRGTVVWGYPALDHPRAVAIVSHSLSGWLGQALRQDPLGLLAVMGQLGFWFLAHARPFYSLAHNLAAGLSSLCLLALGLWGLFAGQGPGRERALGWAMVLVQLGLCMLTWADWDGRFLTRVTPALMLLAAEALLGQAAPGPSMDGPGRFEHL